MSLTRKIIDFLTGRPSPRRLRFDDSTSIVPGDMVVCVAGGRWSQSVSRDGVVSPCNDVGPLKDRTYLVDAVVAFECGAIGLLLRDFPGKLWAVRHFKKTRSTSIDCFKSLLNPSPEEVLAGTAGGNDYDVPSVAADERTSFLPGVSSRCLTAPLLLSGGGGPSFLHRVTSRERLERLGFDKPGTAGARPLGGCGGGGEPPWCGDEHITTGDTRDVGILTRACG